MYQRHSRLLRSRSGFTLVELLVVIAIILVFINITSLVNIGNLSSQKLRGEAITFSGDLHLALLKSVKNNSPVLFRLYEHSDPTAPAGNAKRWRSWQMLQRGESDKLQTLSEVSRLETGVIICGDKVYSTIFNEKATGRSIQIPSASKGDSDLPSGIGYDYRYLDIQINPNGSNNLALSNTDRTWAVTFIMETETPPPSSINIPADNYRTVLIDPFNSRTTIY